MSVEVQELPCREGHIGVLTLNTPATLNALSEAMIVTIKDSLARWGADERICVVLITRRRKQGVLRRWRHPGFVPVINRS